VALEAGNSASIIFKHYRELTTPEVAEKWFSILPKGGKLLAAKQSHCIRAFSGSQSGVVSGRKLSRLSTKVFCTEPRGVGAEVKVFCTLPQRVGTEYKSVLYSAAKGRDRVQKCFVLCRKGSGPR
jgi:hypothetical protein